jgi:hypothetical protein
MRCVVADRVQAFDATGISLAGASLGESVRGAIDAATTAPAESQGFGFGELSQAIRTKV